MFVLQATSDKEFLISLLCSQFVEAQDVTCLAFPATYTLSSPSRKLNINFIQPRFSSFYCL